MVVKLYSTPTCPFCQMAKEFLRKSRVQFEEVNVAADQEAAREMVRKSGQFGVPVIDLDGTIVVGFDRDKIQAALKHSDSR